MDSQVVRYRNVESADCAIVGSDGTVWQGSEDGIWYRVMPRKKTKPTHSSSVTLNRNGKRASLRVAYLVLEAFCGKCPKRMRLYRGSNGNDSDALSNLRWDYRYWEAVKNDRAYRKTHLPPLPELEGIRILHCPGHEGYAVDELGNVWTSRHSFNTKWEQMKSCLSLTGYPCVGMCSGKGNDTRIQKHIHRLVLEAFVGPCPPKMEACHYPDHTRTNVALSNLHWGTRKTNVDERREHGNGNVGSRNPMAKLTEHQVLEIRKTVKCRESRKCAAAKYGISERYVRAICERRTWTHI